MDPTSNMMSSFMNTNLIGLMSMRNDISIYQILFGIIVMNFMNFLPTIKKWVIAYLQSKYKNTKEKLENVIENKINEKKEIKSSICFTKKQKDDNHDIIFNAINYFITNNNNAKFLHYLNDFSVVNKERFQITENVFCIVDNDYSKFNNDDENPEYTIKIFSYEIELAELKQFIESMKQKYIYEQKNKLGFQRFYFDEKNVILPMDQDGSIRYDTAPKNLTFSMTPFNTNKSLTNVFGDHLHDLKERVNMFLHNKEWYNKKGIPYTLGIMLHGPPGTGKTSIIKAISKDSQRHVFNIKITKYTTQTQLRNLFFDEKVDVVQNGKTESFNIPISDRLYVIEDIDCLTDILNDRGIQENTDMKYNNDLSSKIENKDITGYDNIQSRYDNVQSFVNDAPYTNYNDNNLIISDRVNNTTPQPFIKEVNKQTQGEELNLSFILNLFDGILETPGRIVIITSNYPDKLDKAFIRPGRIDINLEVGYCNKDMIIKMFSFFYETDCSKLFVDFKYNKNITPAELNRLILNNYNDIDLAFNSLIKLQS